MTVVFSSCALRINLLTTLCLLSVTTLSIPVMAAPQEVCVKTTIGDVVCGTPVSKPDSSSKRTGNNGPIQTTVNGNVTWELKSCARTQSTVSCTLSLSAKEDSSYGVYLSNNITKLVDNGGNEYYSNRLQIADKSVGEHGDLYLNLAQGAQYTTTIDFINVPSSVTQATLLQFHTGSGPVKFRNVQIN